MDIFLRKRGLGEVILFFIPVLVCIIGTIIAITSKDFDYLKKCVIAGYPFLALFVWRLCSFFYYKDISSLVKDNEQLNSELEAKKNK
ncbi:hypothetical protein IW492_12190 [Enterococcus sp. BWB1-3]|uniref:hypothetical protein n=1 Tax=Enterococcus sp. BWB1-3 TaxID=2787713 RepID=UPI001920F3BF|nr:hypothetical protein [Enterococcus sp. BWB1-3]MBL1229993.1 hypothetical protein [Enterococcus sp. BWB1-3]